MYVKGQFVESLLKISDILLKEKPSNADLSPTQTATALQILHPLSRSLHVIQGLITDQQEGLEYLCSVHQRLMVLLGNPHELEDAEYTADLFSYIKTQAGILKRWAINFDERIAIRTNLLFNMSAQSDNRTNLDIAKFTSKIAVTTQEDSSSMITYVLFS